MQIANCKCEIENLEALRELAEHCRRFSPTVGVEPPDCLLLDITGLAHLFGGEAALVRKVAEDFAHRGLAARMAVADTFGAAWALTHYAEDCKLDVEPPSSICNSQFSICNLPPGQTAALRPLPIESLRLPPETVALLHQLGLYQIGQVEALPREDLTARFGPRLLERLDQATGRLPEPILADEPRPRFAARWSLEYPTGRREIVEGLVEQLIGRVAAELWASGHGALQLECRLTCAHQYSLSVGLFEPTASVGHLFELVRLQLERLRIAAPVSGVEVEVPLTAPLETRQQELFADEPQRRNPRRLAALVERLGSRLGRRAVLGVRLLADAQPELAFRCDPLIGGPRPRRRRTAVALPPRPLRLLARPARLEAVICGPDGVPRQFHWQGHAQQVARSWGPERIETGWWRGRAAGRDYYRVETAAGHRFWLFARLRDGRWFLHGMFE